MTSVTTANRRHGAPTGVMPYPLASDDPPLQDRTLSHRSVVVSTSYQESSILSLAKAADAVNLLERLVLANVPDEAMRSRLSAIPALGTSIAGRLGRFEAPLPAESHLFTAGRLKSALWFAGLGSHGLDGAFNLLFDRAVAARLEPATRGLFVGQPYSSLDSIQKARALGYTTVLNHVNCNLHTENEAIGAESLSLGIRPRSLWPDWIVRRVDAEVAAADAVLVPSRVVWEDLVRRGVAEHKLVLLPYGVDPDAFAPPHDRRLDTLRVLYVGQIAVRKGLQYLDRAIERCHAPVAECLAIGPVLDRALLRHAPNVRFRPQLPSRHIRAAMQQASVFVFPSLAEGMARVVLEAMACGLPVITTREAGYDDVITSGVNGFLVPARDPRAIADVLEMLSANPGRAREIGHNARQTALAYTWSRHGDGFLRWLSGAGTGGDRLSP